MIPPLIVERAIEAGLDIIAVTDHNSAENVESVIRAAEGTSLKVIPGIECETVEGVHIVCLFDEPSDALRLQEIIYSAMPVLPNPGGSLGEQFVVDSEGEFIRHCERVLLVPTDLSIKRVWEAVEGLGGLAIPAHVDRRAYGMCAILGFMPAEPDFRAVQVSRQASLEEVVRQHPDLAGRKLIQCSDAHSLDQIGMARTTLDLEHRTVADIRRVIRDS